MNARFVALLVAMFLVGGGLVLLLKPQLATQTAPPPISAPATPSQPTKEPDRAPEPAAKPQFLILAASWQPAFCETAPDKPECQSLGQKRFDASHFALHGLWPTDSYCDVSATQRKNDEAGRWAQLPPIELDAATRAVLDQAMPGTRSQLERHEWIKHGTCYGEDADRYFGTAVLLLATLNASDVQELFASNIGRQLSAKRIRAAFDSSFGTGAGARVKVACADDGDRRVITEITLGLYGVPGDTPNLGRLLLGARPTSPGCDGGIVDAVGLQ